MRRCAFVLSLLLLFAAPALAQSRGGYDHVNRWWIVGAGQSIIFEGATNDDYETTLGVVDPTADNVVSIPNATGDVCVDTIDNTFTEAQTIYIGDLHATTADGLVIANPTLSTPEYGEEYSPSLRLKGYGHKTSMPRFSHPMYVDSYVRPMSHSTEPYFFLESEYYNNAVLKGRIASGPRDGDFYYWFENQDHNTTIYFGANASQGFQEFYGNNLTITAGDAGDGSYTTQGGNLELFAGMAKGATAGVGGHALLYAGDGDMTASSGGQGGDMEIGSGTGDIGGTLAILAGWGTDGAGGDVTIDAGSGGTVGSIIIGGNVASPVVIGQDTTTTTVNGSLIVNEGGVDMDTRMEGNGDANLLYLDAGNDRVGIGDSTPDRKFDVEGESESSYHVQKKAYHANNPRPDGFPGNATYTAYDDEFDTGSLGVKWSWFSASAPTTVDLSTYPGLLALYHNNAKTDQLLQAISWAGDFDVVVAVRPPLYDTANQKIGVCVCDDSGDNGYAGVLLTVSGQSYCYLQTGTFSGGGALGSTANHETTYAHKDNVYIRLFRSGTTLYVLYSEDGISWINTHNWTSVSTTFTKLGLYMGLTANLPWSRLTVDWIRVLTPTS